MALRISRRIRFLAAGLLGAVSLFGAGGALGYALNDSGSDDTPPGDVPLATRPSTGYQASLDPYGRVAAQPETQAGFGGGVAPAAPGVPPVAEVARDAKIAPPYGLCQAPIGNVVAGGILDLSKAGFAARLLDGGFVLTSVAIRSEGECGDDYRAETGDLVLDTSWLHSETGFMVQVTQREQTDRTANVIYPESAQFWEGGYQFTAWVNAYLYYPAAKDSIAVEPAPEPRVVQVRDTVLNQLAPSTGLQCYFRQEPGTWTDLASLGIGDPRPALPSGYSEATSYIFKLVKPAAGCPGADLEPQVNAGFNASFQAKSGDGWIEVGAWPQYEKITYPGYIDGNGANWSNGRWQFSVYGNRAGSPLGADAIEAIARALDPQFDSQCFLKERELRESEISAPGFRTPLVPDGYRIAKSALRVSDVAKDCNRDNVAAPNYSLNWVITNGDNTYEVYVNRMAQVGGPVTYPAGGWISDYAISWTDSAGTNYTVGASSSGVTGIPDRKTMIAIAESLDAKLDVSKLSEGGRPLPMPAEKSAGASSGSSSTP